MFTIKICGITRPEDAQAAAAGRRVRRAELLCQEPAVYSMPTARAIIIALPKHVVKVGLFVNAQPEEICRLYDDLKLDLIQLHGDESPEVAAGNWRPAHDEGISPRWSPGRPTSILNYLGVCRTPWLWPRLVLFDAPLNAGFGGSGRV